MSRQHIRLTTINFPMVLRVVGWLLMIEGAFLVLPLMACAAYGETDMEAFAISAVATALTGLLMTFGIRPSRTDMGKREGFLLTALVWVFFSAFGMLPFMLCSHPLELSDAFFEAMSGFTTTGASALTSVEMFSHGILLWRCLMQWIGGMGIILFTLAVIPMLNHSGGMQMFNAEVTGITHDKLRPRISQTAKGLWFLYFLLTAILTLLLWIGPMDFFDSLCHAFSSISTGGYSTRDDSIGAWNSAYVKLVITIFMFLGGANFGLMYKAMHGNLRCFWRNDVFKAYIRIILVFYIFFVIAIVGRGQVTDLSSFTLDPLFQIISTITSTGLTVNNFESWGTFVLALLFLLMFFGSCAGSTSGGAKIDRILFLLKNSGNEVYRCIHPNTMMSVRINDKVIAPDVVSKVIAFLCIYVMIIAAGGILLTAFNIPLVDAFFSSFSCVSNTGLGTGVTGYGESYAIIPASGKWVLSLLMLTGRLEIFTVLLLFTPGFWRK
ncbi:TrkH family potassium uptake protein [Paramuribaculum intestinale]|uniref:TrkH family potassium uptake protein n=1 Tax=Paramuribaculum intestinale TaxID=2094151 RepID=UPI0027306710|nr:potassium transporter TrkG [Paramuribaculum intestinale]